MFNIHGWQDLESFLKILIILFGVVKAGPSLVRTAKDRLRRRRAPKSTEPNNTSQKDNYIEIQQFTAFKPLAHRPKPMLAKP